LPRNLLSELFLFLLYLAGRRPKRLVWDADGKQTDGTPRPSWTSSTFFPVRRIVSSPAHHCG
jgi:hypothetical protein